MDSIIKPISFELSVLAKPYFDAKFLFVAVEENRIVGFAHLGFPPTRDYRDLDMQQSILCCLCVIPHSNEAEIAAELLARVGSVSNTLRVSRIQVMPMAPDCPFYLGLAPGDGISGVLTSDTRLRSWLIADHFDVSETVNVWELDAARFHCPMDRIQIQIRRMAHVDRYLAEPVIPWWPACVLGHTDQFGFQLTHHKEKRVVCEALFWIVDNDVKPQLDIIARLWLADKRLNCEMPDHSVFLLSESIRQLFVDRVQTVRAFARSSDSELRQIFGRLGMTSTQEGTVYSKSLA